MASGTIVFFLDQLTKRLIELRPAASALRIGSMLELRHRSSARSHYRRSGVRITMVVVWLAAVLSAFILARTGGPLSSPALSIAAGAAIGGAAGNLADVLRSKSVRDFIDLGWWPAFNIADIAILGGIAFAFFPR